jgi:hypothetical protein
MIVIFFILLSILSVVVSFHTFQSKYHHTASSLRVKPGSYLEKLEQARREKLGQSGLTNTATSSPPVPKVSPPVQQRVVEQVKIPPPEASNNVADNGLPFSDEIYDHMKYVINSISQRMKSDHPFSVAEVNKIKQSLDAILKDALRDSRGNTQDDYSPDQMNPSHEGGPREGFDAGGSSSYVSSSDMMQTSSSPPSELDGNPFKVFQGSSWNIPG